MDTELQHGATPPYAFTSLRGSARQERVRGLTLRKRDVNDVRSREHSGRNVRRTVIGGSFRNRSTIDVGETDWWNCNVNVNVGDVWGV